MKTIHIACEDINFVWTKKQVKEFREMWRDGKSIPDIADELGREHDEVVILAIDQARSKRIIPRQGGMMGEMW